MDRLGKINYEVHGCQREAFVCQHIVESLHTGEPVGFHWAADSTDPYPDAWGSACEAARLLTGGEWTPEFVAQLKVKLLCCMCYGHAKEIWLRKRKPNH